MNEAPTILPNALYVANHSGGKDSQAMYLYLSQHIPASQLVVIHAHLPEVEWKGTMDHIKATIGQSEFHVVQAVKTFFQMVEHRQMFPSAKYRQCTSDLKRGPIQKKIIELCNARGITTVVNCMGLRAQESPNRAKKNPYRISKVNSNSKRTWYEWLPIHSWSTKKVFEYIRTNDQQPHWAYAEGMTRLSCCFCIMSSKADLKTAARLNPDLYQRYLETEKRIDHTFIQPTKKHGKRFLDEIITT